MGPKVEPKLWSVNYHMKTSALNLESGEGADNPGLFFSDLLNHGGLVCMVGWGV